MHKIPSRSEDSPLKICGNSRNLWQYLREAKTLSLKSVEIREICGKNLREAKTLLLKSVEIREICGKNLREAKKLST